ncbi:MAG TPA: FG-GAP-like repeat-containing protein [Lacunisphaera sp.]|nr:FG-GAP-like repeat-containing protein [Lacunisphaera sp.]
MLHPAFLPRRIARGFGLPLVAGVAAITVLAGRAEEPAGIAARDFAVRSGPRGPTLFTELSPGQTGIVTTNNYADPAMWGERYHEFEVGAVGTGVAIADYDGAGRPDILGVSKTESCRLFRNLGGWKFEDVTDRAGVGDPGTAAKIWKQGAAFADVNNDGRPDLYICRFNAPNLLYVNQGDGTFREMAHACGLDVKDASVMAAFCDYDRDGWLDVFVQTNLLDFSGHPAGQRNHLFHNRRDGTFTEVTEQAGITGEAQGHSAVWWDYNNDGWPDLYVANDFAQPDKLYRNNRDGTFTDVIDQVVPHLPYSSMGSDGADVDNDGRIDLFVADMAATTHEKDQRGMADSRGRTVADDEITQRAPQYERNVLYLNTGTGRCEEAAFLTGLAATDWTWSPRFEDLDNDGRVDLFVTNGMVREATNVDLLARQMSAGSAQERLRVMQASPPLAEANLAFRNLGGLQFEEVGAAWGLNQRGVSFGAAFGDLDGDGDLDLVFTNYRKGVTILRNDSDRGHRVIVDLRGTASNRFGVGAVVKIETSAGVQVRQLVLARGVLSTSEPAVHFGLGEDNLVKQLTVDWPSGRRQVFTGLAGDRRYSITEPAASAPAAAAETPTPAQFEEVSQAVGLLWQQREDSVDETAMQRLLPRRLNRRGPALAVAETGGPGGTMVVVGGTTRDPWRAWRRGADGRFSPVARGSSAPGPVDDGPVLLFEANGDGRPDLLVTRGGSALAAGAREYQPQLYLGDSQGSFQPAPEGALPSLPVSAGAAVGADFDHDGRLDLFIGGRVEPGLYPTAPRSAFLLNRGGRFDDVTDAWAPSLRSVGMVTAALASDVDGDGWPDLLVALDWGQVKYFHNNAGRGFEDRTDQAGFGAAGTGWWTSLCGADFNGDGRPDYVAGNLGLNSQYQADAAHPALLDLGDFKGTGEDPQLIEAYYEGGRIYPWRSRRDLGAALPAVLRRFPRNNDYARATLPEVLGNDRLQAAQRWAATELRSGVFLSQADGTYRFEPLPRLAQLSPFQGIVAGDFDGDGQADIYAVQNSFAPIPAVGRFDGGLSQLLRGDGHGHFTPVPPAESGLVVPGDAKALALLDLDHDGWPDFLATRNDTQGLAFRNRGQAGRHSLCVQLNGPAGNPTAIGARITVKLTDGSTQTVEIAAGSGCYSESAGIGFFGWRDGNSPREIRVRWPLGETTTQPVAAGRAWVTIAAP